MRDARFRFSDDVRATTRAIALRMIHADTVATSPEALGAWIAQTEDIRERLTKGGYGSAFDAGDLFPLFQGFVAKGGAGAPTPARSRAGAGGAKWPWVVMVVAIVLVVAVITALRVAS